MNDEYTITVILVFAIMLMVFLLLMLAETVYLYSHRLIKLQEENKRLRKLIQEGFLLGNDGMAVFNKMFSAACLHGFRDSDMDEVI